MKTTQWTIDPSHSEIQFKVKHLLISTVTGQFNTFQGTVEMENDDLATAQVNFTADVDSISTNNDQRDAHLKSGDFFESDQYPKLHFASRQIEKMNDELFKVHGTLTMRGVSKDITLDAEYGGMTQDPWGNTRGGISISGKINRKDFGINFGLLAETGGVALSDEVKILANAEFVKQAERVAA
jgi:polyisoprenoid-binding protein YceI